MLDATYPTAIGSPHFLPDVTLSHESLPETSRNGLALADIGGPTCRVAS